MTPHADFKSLALTLRTQAATDLSSQGRSVFAIGIDSVFALDADTGDPIWRHPIGVDSPFAPIAVKGTEPGVLVFSTLSGELQLLSQKDGHLLWRQPLRGTSQCHAAGRFRQHLRHDAEQ